MLDFNKRLIDLEKTVNELKSSDKIPVMTDPISYTDPTGKQGYYRRIGSFIEFSADYPPSGINIISDTLTKNERYKIAQVIGWSSTTFLEDEKFAAKVHFGIVRMDTHNMIDIRYNETVITAPIDGTYKGTFEVYAIKGEQIKIVTDRGRAMHLTVKRM